MIVTPIQVYIKDIPEPPGSKWQLGLFDYTENQKAWGLVFEGMPTQMNYRWPQDNAKEIILREREKYKNDPNENWLRWYFDAGLRLYVTHEDLEKACKLLGIWDIKLEKKEEEPKKTEHLELCLDRHGFCKCKCEECLRIIGRHCDCICVICKCRD